MLGWTHCGQALCGQELPPLSVDAILGAIEGTGSPGGVSVGLSIIAGPSGNIKPGDLVSITINGDGTETLYCDAGPVTVLSNDGTTLTYSAPEPALFGNKSLTYNNALTFTVERGSETADFSLVIEPRDTELHSLITSVHAGGIYDGDGVNVGVDYGHIKNISPGINIDPADGSYTVTAAGTAEYAIYDGAWSDYFLLNFEAPEVTVDLGAVSGTGNSGSVNPVLPDGPVSIPMSSVSGDGNAGSVTANVETPVEVDLGSASGSGSVGGVTPVIDNTSEVNTLSPTPIIVKASLLAQRRPHSFPVFMDNLRNATVDFEDVAIELSTEAVSFEWEIEEGMNLTFEEESLYRDTAQVEILTPEQAGETLVRCTATMLNGEKISAYFIIEVIDPSL